MNSTIVRLIIESCLGKGTKQDQADEIIKALKEKNFHIVDKNFIELYTTSKKLVKIIENALGAAQDLEEFDISDYSCQ
jgi:hypothetical protein